MSENVVKSAGGPRVLRSGTFLRCTRDSCHWHGLSDRDRQRILLGDSSRW